ncbi:MAG: DUF5906 domain-containing protein [Azoarcus sp.]|jgi:hypothetical protein|nr:DUF5906 domain-containing protein [Azoarcus sp.]
MVTPQPLKGISFSLKIYFLEHSSMDIFFLGSDVPLTKTFTLKDGAIEKSNYPPVKNFTSFKEQITTLADLHTQIKAHALNGHCLLKGTLARDLTNESRAGHTDTSAPTKWVCLDFDDAPYASVEKAMEQIPPLADVSYIVQYSASHGITPTPEARLRCHVFMLLSHPMPAPYLKTWLQLLNLNTKGLHDAVELSATNAVLSWPLDITACQNDKLLYIAPPVLNGIKPPLKDTERYQYVKRVHDTIPIERLANIKAEAVATQAHQLLNTLREAQGLPKRRANAIRIERDRTALSQYVITNPGEAVITGVREARGFVYLNLNGGDSWSYYHPVGDYEYIYCFKHPEEHFRTRELLPTYYAEKRKHNTKKTTEGETLLAFRDFKSDTYYNILWNPHTYELNVSTASNTTKIAAFYGSRGSRAPDQLPDGEIFFDPTDEAVVDAENHRVNLYVPTAYMREAAAYTGETPEFGTGFPTIAHLIKHVVARGLNDETCDHFLNWLAVIYQHRCKTQTAWILSGTEGTGKGTLINHILAPTLGKAYVKSKNADMLKERFNEDLLTSLIMSIDEVELSETAYRAEAQSRLRRWITDSPLDMRAMHTNLYLAPNYTNFILSTNSREPIYLDENDRRYNVGAFQHEKLAFTGTDIRAIHEELPYWMQYIMRRTANVQQAATVNLSDWRQDLTDISKTSADIVVRALKEGNFMFFFRERPQGGIVYGSFEAANNYQQVILDIAKMLIDSFASYKVRAPNTDSCRTELKISRDALFTLFSYCVGNVPTSPTKFSRYLNHRGLPVQQTWISGENVQGVHILWTVHKQDAEELRKWVAQNSGPPLRLVK